MSIAYSSKDRKLIPKILGTDLLHIDVGLHCIVMDHNEQNRITTK